MDALACDEHRTPTRLTCVTCGRPICPRCLVTTRVGFKCRAHPATKAPATKAPPPLPAGAAPRASRVRPPPSGRAPVRAPVPARRASGGPFRFFPFFLLLWLLPTVLAPLEALFEATAHWTGASAYVPLVAVLVAIVGGGLVLAAKVSRRA